MPLSNFDVKTRLQNQIIRLQISCRLQILRRFLTSCDELRLQPRASL